MIVSDLTSIAHPSWCSPEHCDAGQHVDVRHSSTPVTWTAEADDVDLAVALHRDDERGVDGEPLRHVRGLLLSLENTAVLQPDGSVERADVLLSEQDVLDLIGCLQAHLQVLRAT